MESGNIRHAVIQGFLWFCLIASVIALIALLVFSFLQLASGNQTFGLSTLAFSSLFGAVIVAILNWVYFEPQGAEKERERDSEERQYQRERDADERKYERDRDKAEQERKEEHEQKVTEGQKLQLRKALYNEIVIVYCTSNRHILQNNARCAYRRVALRYSISSGIARPMAYV